MEVTMKSTATAYLRSGLCVLPAIREEKRTAFGLSWKEFQERLPTEEEVDSWFPRASALCIVAGDISGGLEMIDFDNRGELFAAWKDIVEAQGDLFSRLLVETSQSGGKHVVFRCESAIEGNLKLAERLIPTPDKTPIVINGKTYKPAGSGPFSVTLTLIETRGEGGLFLCAPSPGYVIEQGSFENLPILTASERAILISAARSLTENVPQVERHASPVSPESPDVRPGDEFNESGDVRSVLIRAGWSLVRGGSNEYWRRPGKNGGWSATLKDRVLYVFSSNCDPFEPGKAYAPFSVYALLEHGGNFAAAASELISEGYGIPKIVPTPVDLSGFMVAAVRAATKKPEPFPDECLRPPGLIGDVIDYTLSTSRYPQPELALAGALALMSVLTGRKVMDEGRTRTNLLLMGLCPAAAGKDRSRQVNKEILIAAGGDALIGPESIGSSAGLVCVLDDSPATLFQLDEIGKLFVLMQNPKAGHLYKIGSDLLKLYSSSGGLYIGDALADKKKIKRIKQPHCVIYGTSTPEVFWETLTAENVKEGLVGRFLVFDALRGYVLPKVQPHREVPQSIIDRVRWWLDFSPGKSQGNLAEFSPNPIVVQYGAGAAERLQGHERNIAEKRLGEERTKAAIWSRTAEKTNKLALLMACSRAELREPAIITEEDADTAVRLTNWLTRQMLARVFDHVSESDSEARLKKVLRKIGTGIRRNAFTRATQFLRDSRERNEILRTLVECGYVAIESIETGGKPAEWIRRVDPDESLTKAENFDAQGVTSEIQKSA